MFLPRRGVLAAIRAEVCGVVEGSRSRVLILRRVHEHGWLNVLLHIQFAEPLQLFSLVSKHFLKVVCGLWHPCLACKLLASARLEQIQGEELSFVQVIKALHAFNVNFSIANHWENGRFVFIFVGLFH